MKASLEVTPLISGDDTMMKSPSWRVENGDAEENA
jgi:hypothetical protein